MTLFPQAAPDPTSARSGARSFGADALFFLILVIVFGWQPLFGGRTIAGNGDIVSQYLPYKQIVRDQLAQGVFPHWNPLTFCGRPLQADIQIGLFYPFNLFFWLAPLDWAFDLATLFHMWAGALGMAWWLRGRGRSRAARWLAGGVFMLCGYQTTRLWSGVVLFIFAAAWLPWMLGSWDRFCRARKEETRDGPWRFLLLVFFMVCSILAGAPQITFYSFAMLGFYALFLAWKPARRADDSDTNEDVGLGEDEVRPLVPLPLRLQPLLFLALAVLLAAGICAVQILPTAMFINESWDRAVGASWDYVADGSLEYRSLLNFVSPFFFGEPFDEAWYWGQSQGGYHEITAHVGAIPLLLVAFFLVGRAMVARSNRRRDLTDSRSQDSWRVEGFLVAMLLIALLFAPGRNSPFFWLAYHLVPGFDRFRVPGRFLLFFMLAASALSGWALDHARTWSDSLNRGRVGKILVIFGLLFALGGFLLWLTTPTLMENIGTPHLNQGGWEGRFSDDLVRMKGWAREGALRFAWQSLAGGLLLAGLTLPLRPSRAKVLRPVLAGLFVALALGELLFFGAKFQKPTPRAELYQTYWPESPRVDFLKGALRADERFLWMESLRSYEVDRHAFELLTNRPVLYGLNNMRGYDPVNSRRLGLYYNLMSMLPMDVNPRGMLYALDEPPDQIQWRLIELWNCRIALSYSAITDPRVEEAASWTVGSGRRSVMRAYRLKNPVGPAWLMTPHAISPDLSPTRMASLLIQPSFDPRTMALIQVDPVAALGAHPGPLTPRPDLTAEVELLESRPDVRRFRVRSPNLAVLALSESWYPGWKAKIDGGSAFTFPANLAFCATVVPPGEHEVEFRYRPRQFYQGAWISLISLLLLAATIRKLREQSADYL